MVSDFKLVTFGPQQQAQLQIMKETYCSKYGEDMVFDVAEADEMYQTRKAKVKNDAFIAYRDYFTMGDIIYNIFQNILEDNKIKIGEVDDFLDFACGYGRMARFFKQRLPKNALTVSDIDKAAVDFVAQRIGARGLYSSFDPDDFAVKSKFDVIFVLSLFTHLRQPEWQKWLAKLHGMLRKEGRLIFSTHGLHQMEHHAKWRAIRSGGYHFAPVNETQGRLPTDYYGGVFVDYPFVKSVVKEYDLGKIAKYYPNALTMHDIYVLTR
jgi:SAM-dependent methyltransferase